MFCLIPLKLLIPNTDKWVWITRRNNTDRESHVLVSTFSTANPTWVDLGWNLGFRGKTGDYSPEQWLRVFGFFLAVLWNRIHAMAQLVEAVRLQAGRSRVRFPMMVSLEFFIDVIIAVALWPWSWFSPFLGRQGGRSVGLITLYPSSEDCLEILEPQPPGELRPVQG